MYLFIFAFLGGVGTEIICALFHTYLAIRDSERGCVNIDLNQDMNINAAR